MVYNVPSENIVKKYFDIEHKEKVDKKIINKWKKEFSIYIKQLLKLVYEDEKIIEMCIEGDISFFNLWRRAFMDETADVKNYEPLEFYGDTVFEYIFGKYLYVKYSDKIDKSPDLFSDLKNYYRSGPYMISMGENLNMDKWIIKGDKYVNLTEKMKSNLIESFLGALDFITRGVRSILVKNKDYERLINNSFSADACYIFLKNYFEIYGFNEDKRNSLKGNLFLGMVCDVFGAKGEIKITKGDPSGTFFVINITSNLINILKEELGLNKTQVALLKKLNDNTIFKEESKDKNELAYTIQKNIFEKELNITTKKLEEIKEFAKIDSISEPYKTQLKEKALGNKRYTRIKFSVPNSQKVDGECTIIMYRLTGNDKGELIKQEKLKIYTGRCEGTGFPINLRDKLVKEYLSEV